MDKPLLRKLKDHLIKCEEKLIDAGDAVVLDGEESPAKNSPKCTRQFDRPASIWMKHMGCSPRCGTTAATMRTKTPTSLSPLCTANQN